MISRSGKAAKVLACAFIFRLVYGCRSYRSLAPALSKNDSQESQKKATLASLFFALHQAPTRRWQLENALTSYRTLPVEMELVGPDGQSQGGSEAIESPPAPKSDVSTPSISTPTAEDIRPLVPLIELTPMATGEGNVDPELVERVNREVFELTGVNLDDLLNPSKVVNLERDLLLTTAELEACTDSEQRGVLEKKLDKIETDLYREKRTVFRGWLKNVFIGQSVLAILVSGLTVYNEELDLSLRALAFWSYWLFIIPSLRARRPRGWEKKALNVAFLGSPLLTFAMPFITKDPPAIWLANLVLLVASYGYGYASGDSDEVGGFTGVLKWLDFGSGQERGLRSDKREALEQQKLRKKDAQE